MNGIRDIFGPKDNSKILLQDQRKRLFKEFKDLYVQMECTEMWFQMEEDEDLIEASIYQIESLRARYRYLLKKAKDNNLKLMQR